MIHFGLRIIGTIISAYLILGKIEPAEPKLKSTMLRFNRAKSSFKRSFEEEPVDRIILKERELETNSNEFKTYFDNSDNHSLNFEIKKRATNRQRRLVGGDDKSGSGSDHKSRVDENAIFSKSKHSKTRKLKKIKKIPIDDENDEDKTTSYRVHIDQDDDENDNGGVGKSYSFPKKLNKQQLEQIYRYLKQKQLYESLEDSDVNLPDKLIELLASRTAYDLALKWFGKLPQSSHLSSLEPSSNSLDQLELMFSRIYHFLYSILKSAQSKLKAFEINRSPNKFGPTVHDDRQSILEYLTSGKNSPNGRPASWFYQNLIEREPLDESKSSLGKYLEAFFYRHFDMNPRFSAAPLPSPPLNQLKNELQTDRVVAWPHTAYFNAKSLTNITPLDRNAYLGLSVGPLKQFYPLAYHKDHPARPLSSNSVRSFHHHFHVYEGPENHYSKPSNFGMTIFRNQKSPVVCTNYPEHSAQGFKSFISVESCTQPSFLSHNGVPVFGQGCTFRYVCEAGFHPVDGLSSSAASPIKCLNGYWSSRAICLRDQETNKSTADNFSSTSSDTLKKSATDSVQKQASNNPINVVHPNYIKRSFNRIKRSDEDVDVDDENHEDDGEISLNDREDKLMRSKMHAFLEAENKKRISNETSSESFIELLDRYNNSSPLLTSNESLNDQDFVEENDLVDTLERIKSENDDHNRARFHTEEGDEKRLWFVKNKNQNMTNRYNEPTRGFSATRKVTKPKKANRTNNNWPLEVDNDLEKSIYEAFEELVDDRN